jgi:hypothetical protein
VQVSIFRVNKNFLLLYRRILQLFPRQSRGDTRLADDTAPSPTSTLDIDTFLKYIISIQAIIIFYARTLTFALSYFWKGFGGLSWSRTT